MTLIIIPSTVFTSSTLRHLNRPRYYLKSYDLTTRQFGQLWLVPYYATYSFSKLLCFAIGDPWGIRTLEFQLEGLVTIANLSNGPYLVPQEGLKPPTDRVEAGCSIQLSYWGICCTVVLPLASIITVPGWILIPCSTLHLCSIANWAWRSLQGLNLWPADYGLGSKIWTCITVPNGILLVLFQDSPSLYRLS